MGKLIWVGVSCCIGALALNLFPALTYEFGIDRGGAWSFFGFGLFLILVSLVTARGARSGRDGSKTATDPASRPHR